MASLSGGDGTSSAARRWHAVRRLGRKVAVEEQFEDGDVLGALDERRLQRRSHERTLADADMGEGVDAVDRLGARRVDPGRAEVARQGDDGVEQSCRELRGSAHDRS